MQQLTETNMQKIWGGTTKISASMINGIIKGATFLLELGRSFGSAIRRSQLKKWC
jgi:hypothetical protein